MSRTKQLAAIMFTDIVGYTAMMQTDEDKAVRALYRHREAIEGMVPEHDGEVHQFYGDGSLSLFTSVSDAVACARTVQINLQKGEVVPLRIGIHIGEVSIEGGKVFGDGVNVASRIESSGHAGTVLLSKGAYDKVRNRKDLDFRSMGMFSFKNVTEPMEVFGLVDEQIPPPDPSRLQNRLEERSRWIGGRSNRLVALIFLLVAIATTIAVVLFRQGPLVSAPSDRTVMAVFPFRIEGNDKLEYLKEGMVDLFSTKLEGIPDLQALDPNIIIANTRKSPVDRLPPAELFSLAQDWGANRFISGSLIQIGSDIRIRVSEYNNGSSPISTAEVVLESEDELLSGIDVLVQESIAADLEQEGQKVTALATMTSSNLDAVKLFLNGENLRRSGMYSAASQEFASAVETDSSMAMAWLRMAQSCSWATTCQLPRAAMVEQIRAHNDRLPRKLREYSEVVAGFYTDEYKTSEEGFRDLLRQYGDEVDFLVGLGEALYHTNEFHGRMPSEAKPYFLKAIEHDPDNIEIRQHLFALLAYDGDTSALNELLSLTPVESDYWYAFKALTLMASGKWTESEVRSILEHPKLDWTILFNSCHIETQIENAVRLMADLKRFNSNVLPSLYNGPPIEVLMYYWQGREQDALDIFEGSPVQEFLPYVMTLKNMDPRMDVHGEIVRETVSKLQPGNTPGLLPNELILALAALQNGMITDYQRNLNALQRRNKNNPQTEWLLGFCKGLYLRSNGQYRQSNQVIDSILLVNESSLFPLFPTPFFDAALMQARAENSFDLGEPMDALRRYDAMLNVMNAGDEITLGYSLLRRGEIAEAAGLINRAIQYYSRFLELYANCDPKYDGWKEIARTNRQRLVGAVN